MHFRFSSIIDMLNKQAESRTDQICLLYPDQTDPHKYATLTYKQFNNVTNHMAQKYFAKLERSSTNETPVVCLLANSNVAYLLSIYALFKINVIIFPLSIRNSDAAIMHLLEKTKASHLLYSEQYSPIASLVSSKFGSKIELHTFEDIRITELVELGEPTFEPAADTDELERVRIIFHSSGSTSFPKPIHLATRCLFGYFETYALELNKCFWTDDDTVLAVQPLFHMGGVSISVALWYVGGAYAMPLTSCFPPSPTELFASIQYTQMTKLFTVALFLEQLINLLHQDDNIDFKTVARLKFVAYGGAACPPHICKKFIENGVNLITTYGSTEMGFVLISDCDMENKYQRQSLRPMRARQSSIKFVPIAPDSNINELLILYNDPFLAPGLIENGVYSPGDLFIEDPPGSGYYVIQGRKDDVLVHTTGEKTNPLPMELVMRQHAIIEQAIVLGHQRFCCSVLIQLNIEEAFKHELHAIEEQVLTAVKDANNDAPSHSRIVPAMVKILPMSKRLPITGKGNVIRKTVELEYATTIEQMYEQFLNSPVASSNAQRRSSGRVWTHDEIRNYLQNTVAQVLSESFEIFSDHSKSLFSLSLDSLRAVELRNMLSMEFGKLDENIIFEFSSIDALADEIFRIVNKEEARISNDPWHYNETEDIIDKYINLMRTYQDQMPVITEKLLDEDDINMQEKRVFLITGANGSLGTQILLHLLNKPKVHRIYCLLRGDNPAERLRRGMQARKQNSAILLDTTRIIVLSMDLDDEKLGQTEAIYDQLRSEVTDIIHSAWKMDFNMTIKDFDRECLKGLYNLLKFAGFASVRLPMRFHFISSIGSAGSGLIAEIKEEPLPRRPEIAVAQGYAQAKYAAEHVCWTAMNLWGVPVDIYRIGQIAGDSETGVWSTAEMIPLIICGGGGELAMLPDDCQRVEWIPVNYAAACVADIAVDTSTRVGPASERVHHILNPHTISWSQLLEHLKMAGLHFRVVSIKDWLQILLSSPQNPAYVLAGFFRKVFVGGKNFELAKYMTEKTARRTTALERCPIVDKKLMQCYLNYWSEIGFLKQGYSRSA